MPSLITEEPDFYNINYYYSKYRNCHSISMSEAKSSSLYILSADINLETYGVKSIEKGQIIFSKIFLIFKLK